MRCKSQARVRLKERVKETAVQPAKVFPDSKSTIRASVPCCSQRKKVFPGVGLSFLRRQKHPSGARGVLWTRATTPDGRRSRVVDDAKRSPRTVVRTFHDAK